MAWLDARRKMLLIHAIDVPKLDELSEQIAKNGKRGQKMSQNTREVLFLSLIFSQ